MNHIVEHVAIAVILANQLFALESFYCGTRTFFNAEVSVSKNSKFITDLSAYSLENISLASEPDSFKVDVTGCLTPIGLIQGAVGIECRSAFVPTIFGGAVQFFDGLRLIKLENCSTKELQAGAFLNLPKLETISLRFNQIEQINAGIFNNLGITKLDLSNNVIYYIEETAFDSMSNLSELNLDRNKLKNWYRDWFSDSPNLIHVSVTHNQLSVLPAYAFSNIKNDQKTTIRLSNNKLSFIHPTAFKGLSKMYGLWLDNNNIKFLTADIFQHFERIYIISIAGNRLTCLSEEFLYGIKSIDVIMRVEDNELMDCRCLRKIEDWAENREYYLTEVYAREECERKAERKANGKQGAF